MNIIGQARDYQELERGGYKVPPVRYDSLQMPPDGTPREKMFDFLLQHRQWLAQRHYNIQPRFGEEKKVPLTLNHNAKKLVRAYNYQRYVKKQPIRWLILKFRQGWFSTDVSYLLHSEGRFGASGDILLAGHEDWSTDMVFEKYKDFEETITRHPSLDVPVVGPNPYGTSDQLSWAGWDPDRLEWSDALGSTVYARSGSFEAATARWMHLTEVGKRRPPQVRSWRDLLLFSIQAIPFRPGTGVFLEGTAEGPAGFLYEMWREAKKKTKDSYGFIPIFFPFYTHEEYRIEVSEDADCEPFGISQKERVHDEKEMNRIREVFNRDPDVQLDRLDPSGWRYKELVRIREEAINWRQHEGLPEQCDGDEVFFRHEYPWDDEVAFTAGGKGIVDSHSVSMNIMKYRDAEDAATEATPPAEFPSYIDEDENCHIFHRPIPNHRYILCGDPSKGQKVVSQRRDPAVGTVFDIDLVKYVAEWRAWETTDAQADYWTDMAQIYNNALVMVELTGGWGDQVVGYMRANGYENFYFPPTVSGIPIPGFSADNKRRDRSVAILPNLLKVIILEDWRYWDEILHFQENRQGKFEGTEGAFDDRVATLRMFGFYLYEIGLLGVENHPEFRKKLREKLILEGSEEPEKKNRIVPVKLGHPLLRFLPRAKRPGVM